MVGAEEAREKALAACDFDDVVLGEARELDTGWHFPLVAKTPVVTGVIVNKHSGRTVSIYPESSLDRDPTLYDRGYQWEAYDVVVLTAEDVDATARTLLALGQQTVDTSYHDGRVWRRKRVMTEDLEKAREAGWFDFKLFEYQEAE